jgi:hypothetical protein
MRIFCEVNISVMVASATEHSEWRTQIGKSIDHIYLCGWVPAEVIPCQNHQIGFQPIGYCHASPNFLSRHNGTDVDIRKLGNAAT